MASQTQAILFCGGRGTRLYPVTDYYQKVMMPIGNEGRPMLEYVIRWLSHQGITDFIALIRYRANQIRRYFGDGSRFGVTIKYVLDDPSFKGTGGALYNARNLITKDHILIYYTDILSSIDIPKLIDFHKAHQGIGTAWIDPNWSVSAGVVAKTDDGSISSIQSKVKNSIYANTGISLLNKDVFEHFKIEETNEIDLSGDIFPRLAEKNQMHAYLSEDWWIDVGSLTRHKKIDGDKLEKQFGFLFEV